MTLINIVSTAIYTNDAPLREKIQTYLLAIVFLVILYNSPCGLVFYWILNNLFSLCKNIVLKMKHPGRIVFIFIGSFLVLASTYLVLLKPDKFSPQKCAFYFCTIIFIAAPFILTLLKKSKTAIKMKEIEIPPKENLLMFLASSVSLWLLCGLLLPSSVISTSPTEFSFLGNTESPLSYIYGSTSFYFGLFVFWPLCIYKLFGQKVKNIISPLFLVLSLCAFGNAYIFKYNYGTIDTLFQLETNLVLKDFSLFYTLGSALFMIVSVCLAFAVVKFKKQAIAFFLLLAISLGESFLGIQKAGKIKKTFLAYKALVEKDEPITHLKPVFHLSKDKENIVVLFMDRAISSFMPYIFNEFPELNETFTGFTYYPNCISFSGSTVLSVPSMVAGYEYMPEEINKRSNEKLVDKYNEALHVIPDILIPSGYNVYMSNPAFMNFDWGVDAKGFDDNENLHVMNLKRKTYAQFYMKDFEEDFSNMKPNDYFVNKNVQSFSLLQAINPLLRNEYYMDGNYYRADALATSSLFNESFLYAYAPLHYLSDLTSVDSDKPGYVFFNCDVTHEYQKLLAPDYRPGIAKDASMYADNGYYNTIPKELYTDDNCNGYHVNVAAFLQIKNFLSYLKTKDVYDNTRIIIVSDHGRGLMTPAFDKMHDTDRAKTYATFNPLLMVKDFNENGKMKTDDTFTTLAETINFVLKDLPVKKENPRTGNEFKTASDFEYFHVYSINGEDWNAPDLIDDNEFVLLKENGYEIHDNIFDTNNWKRLDEK